jgi:leucyl/phenylalanyl-tRNA--protein transferase
VARLKRGGFALLDTQFVTRHLERFGAIEISRDLYRKHLTEALKQRASFPAELPAGALAEALDGVTTQLI